MSGSKQTSEGSIKQLYCISLYCFISHVVTQFVKVFDTCQIPGRKREPWGRHITTDTVNISRNHRCKGTLLMDMWQELLWTMGSAEDAK